MSLPEKLCYGPGDNTDSHLHISDGEGNTFALVPTDFDPCSDESDEVAEAQFEAQEQHAYELVRRWNAHKPLLKHLSAIVNQFTSGPDRELNDEVYIAKLMLVSLDLDAPEAQ